ncbi:hypothetical protein MRX96_041867 [Rhipicephalus microplus]
MRNRRRWPSNGASSFWHPRPVGAFVFISDPGGAFCQTGLAEKQPTAKEREGKKETGRFAAAASLAPVAAMVRQTMTGRRTPSEDRGTHTTTVNTRPDKGKKHIHIWGLRVPRCSRQRD